MPPRPATPRAGHVRARGPSPECAEPSSGGIYHESWRSRRLAEDVFDALEQPFVLVLSQGRRLELLLGKRAVELLEQPLLLFREPVRRDDLDSDDQVAAPAPRHIRHAASSNAERRAGLGS